MTRLFILAMCVAAPVLVLLGTAASIDPDTPVEQGQSDEGTAPGPDAVVFGYVEGRVVAADGQPIVGAMITPRSLVRPSLRVPERAMLTDREGIYRWPLLAGEYEITASAAGYPALVQRVVVRSGETSSLDFVVSP